MEEAVQNEKIGEGENGSEGQHQGHGKAARQEEPDEQDEG